MTGATITDGDTVTCVEPVLNITVVAILMRLIVIVATWSDLHTYLYHSVISAFRKHFTQHYALI